MKKSFQAHCETRIFKLRYYVLDQGVEEVQEIGILIISIALVFQQYNVSIKSIHGYRCQKQRGRMKGALNVIENNQQKVESHADLKGNGNCH